MITQAGAAGKTAVTNVPILAGTDANADSPAPVSHGDSLDHELELLVDAGLTSLDALRAATVLPPRCFRLGDRGVIELGYRAHAAELTR